MNKTDPTFETSLLGYEIPGTNLDPTSHTAKIKGVYYFYRITDTLFLQPDHSSTYKIIDVQDNQLLLKKVG